MLEEIPNSIPYVSQISKMSLFSGAFDPGDAPAIISPVNVYKETKQNLMFPFTTTTLSTINFEQQQPFMMEFEQNEIRRHPSLKQHSLSLEKSIDEEQGFVQKVRAFAQDVAARNLNNNKNNKAMSKTENLAKYLEGATLEDFRLGKLAQGIETEGFFLN